MTMNIHDHMGNNYWCMDVYDIYRTFQTASANIEVKED